jgi:hypothetical protein
LAKYLNLQAQSAMHQLIYLNFTCKTYTWGRPPGGDGAGRAHRLCWPKMRSQAPAASPDFSLFLDVDGTLVELEETPADVVIGEPLKTLLARVARRLDGAVALVSGRSIETLDALFAPLVFPAAGLHGVERRSDASERYPS